MFPLYIHQKLKITESTICTHHLILQINKLYLREPSSASGGLSLLRGAGTRDTNVPASSIHAELKESSKFLPPLCELILNQSAKLDAQAILDFTVISFDNQ